MKKVNRTVSEHERAAVVAFWKVLMAYNDDNSALTYSTSPQWKTTEVALGTLLLHITSGDVGEAQWIRDQITETGAAEDALACWLADDIEADDAQRVDPAMRAAEDIIASAEALS